MTGLVGDGLVPSHLEFGTDVPRSRANTNGPGGWRSVVLLEARARHAPPAEGEATKGRKTQPASWPRDVADPKPIGECNTGGDKPRYAAA